MRSESIAAAVCGGVTSYMDMPNVKPPTVTNALPGRKARAGGRIPRWSTTRSTSAPRTTTSSRSAASTRRRVCGVKVFMGSSTGNLLVDKDAALAALFAESPVPIATHCEDEGTIRADIQRFREEYGDRATAALHPSIRQRRGMLHASAPRPSNWPTATGPTCTSCT